MQLELSFSAFFACTTTSEYDSITGVSADDDILSDDVDQLRAELLAERAARRASEARALGAEAMVAHYKLMIAKLNRERFGNSSERHRKLIDQMVLVSRSDDGHAADRRRFIYPFDSAGLGLELSETVMSNPDAIVIRTDATSI